MGPRPYCISIVLCLNESHGREIGAPAAEPVMISKQQQYFFWNICKRSDAAPFWFLQRKPIFKFSWYVIKIMQICYVLTAKLRRVDAFTHKISNIFYFVFLQKRRVATGGNAFLHRPRDIY